MVMALLTHLQETPEAHQNGADADSTRGSKEATIRLSRTSMKKTTDDELSIVFE
jgi:hypothetical protein